jgi:predicted acylesterase/phospholipase RssA
MLVLMRTIEFGGLSHKKTTSRVADIYLRPPLLKFKRNDFYAASEIAQVGYDHAREQIEAWLKTGTDRAAQDLSSAVHK